MTQKEKEKTEMLSYLTCKTLYLVCVKFYTQCCSALQGVQVKCQQTTLPGAKILRPLAKIESSL